MSVYSEDDLALATSLGAATLHEAAGRTGALSPAIKPVSPDMKLSGQAYCVRVPAGDNLWIHRALYAADKGDILVVDTSGGTEFGYWGDILNEAALAAGLGGLVINGGVRDTARLAEMPFPVFAQTVSIRGTIKGFDVEGHIGKEVTIGDVTIATGDLIVGDRDGVVSIAQALVRTALKAGMSREVDEAAKIEKIRAGARTIDLYQFGEN
jgi:4-hydroxy-4-methyl-2-oxoglutarate aldolase